MKILKLLSNIWSKPASNPPPQDGPVSAEQIKLVQDSWAKVVPISETAAELFYGRLFDVAPDVKPLFKGDMKEQGAKLMKMIGIAVNGLNDLPAIVPAVQELGRNHVGYGVKDEHYGAVGNSLLWTLDQGLGDDFTPDTKAAWTTTYTVLADTMKAAAAELEPAEEGPVSAAEVSLVQESWAKVVPISDTAAELFYGRLFEIAPEVKPLFKGDMKEQGAKLMKMIGIAVNGLTDLPAIVPAVQELGRKHVDYGVKDEHYAVVGESLLWTLDKGLGDEFTDDTKAAWTKVYGVLADTMINASK